MYKLFQLNNVEGLGAGDKDVGGTPPRARRGVEGAGEGDEQAVDGLHQPYTTENSLHQHRHLRNQT